LIGAIPVSGISSFEEEVDLEHHIVIVGAGPRGTYGLRRVLLHLQKHPLKHPVNVHVIEKSGNFGGGGVHSVSQPDYLLLNTVGSQITAFGDDDETARASDARKTLHGYLVANGVEIGPNDYPSRAQHGRYLAAMFDWSERHKSAGVSVHRHHAQVVDIETASDGNLTVALDTGGSVPAHEILLLTGHAENRIVPGSQAESWKAFAERQQRRGKNISYLHLVYPISHKTRYIQPGEAVYVIGMGLTAVDLVKSFTYGRGGIFKDGRYQESGREPFIILGSRLGLPYSARAHNQKADQYQGKILTRDRLAELKRRRSKLDFNRDLMPLILQEMAYVYYQTLAGDGFGERFLACSSEDERQRLIAQAIPAPRRFSWEDIVDPFRHIDAQTTSGRPWFASLQDYTRFVLDTLRTDIAEAQMGNMVSPLKTAVDAVLRDLRDLLRSVVDFGGLTAASHRDFERMFSRINNRIAVGPPVSSTRELMILAESGIVSFSGPMPRISLDEDQGVFAVESDQVAGSRRSVQHILNGRIHSVDNRNDTSPLIQNLFRRGLIRNFVNRDETGTYELGGLDVTEDFHIIGTDGRAHPHICALGIPLEGKLWFNAADARPDVNSNAIGQLSRWTAAAVSRLGARETP
jgi:uncharacterized NAD(P)/FAD-binding protein YdhS